MNRADFVKVRLRKPNFILTVIAFVICTIGIVCSIIRLTNIMLNDYSVAGMMSVITPIVVYVFVMLTLGLLYKSRKVVFVRYAALAFGLLFVFVGIYTLTIANNNMNYLISAEISLVVALASCYVAGRINHFKETLIISLIVEAILLGYVVFVFVVSREVKFPTTLGLIEYYGNCISPLFVWTSIIICYLVNYHTCPAIYEENIK